MNSSPFESLEAAALVGMSCAVVAANTPDRTAIFSEFGNCSFAELNCRANQLARFLRAQGLREGHSVALLCSNRPEFAQVLLGTMRSGFRVTPINWHLTAEEIGYIVDNCDARAFIADARYSGKAMAALDHAPAVELRLSIGGSIDGFAEFHETLEQQHAGNIDDPVLGGSMLYTSGTTGRPKGVYRKERAPVMPQLDGTPSSYDPMHDVELCTGPAYHAAPLLIDVIQPLVSGVPVVFMDKWDPEYTLKLIERHGVTHCHMVATMFHRLLQLPEELRNSYDVSSLKVVVHGAAPCPVHVKKAMIEWLGPVLLEYYAATEGGGGFLVDSNTWLKKPGTVGKPGPDFDNRILDDEGRDVPRGVTGTIYMRAPATGRFEYYKDQDKTASSYSGDYFTLGDMGYFDEDGYLFLTGRTAELIISGGVNIYPQEVDSEIMQHPAILDICTIGIPNDEWGEEVKAVVQLNEGYEPGEALTEELMRFARSRLPGFKVPRSIDYTTSLPRLPTGKIQRRLVREPYWDGRDRKI